MTTIQNRKHLAFLLHYPSKNKCLLWPDYYENAKEEIDASFVEIDHDISNQIGFKASLMKEKDFKVFIKKTKKDKTN